MSLKVFHFPKLPQFAFTTGILTYPLTFLMTDTVSEIWGERHAKFMIFLGFAMNLLMCLFVQTIIHLPPNEFWFNPNNLFGYTSHHDFQNAFVSVYSINGKIFIASMMAYLISQWVDIKLFCSLKKKTKNRHLWLRNNASTLTSQLLDTLIMNYIILHFGLKLEIKTCLSIAAAEYAYKALIALLDTPFIYLIVSYLKPRRPPSYVQTHFQ